MCVGHANHREFVFALALSAASALYAASLALTALCTPTWWFAPHSDALPFRIPLYSGFLLPADCRFVYAQFLYASCVLAIASAYACA